jgi:hypothetical protein
MRKLYLLVCSIFCTAVIIAQPTLQYPQNAPTLGDVSEIQFVSTAGLTHEPVGPDVTWDFSSLEVIFGGEITAIDPVLAPAGDQFPASNVTMRMENSIFTFALTNTDGY